MPPKLVKLSSKYLMKPLTYATAAYYSRQNLRKEAKRAAVTLPLA